MYTSAEAAYRDVKERILTGTLAGGELISEGEIAASLGTSRTPVREAFLRLEAEGWMKLYPKRGALIVPISVDEAEHVARARFIVETGAVRALATPERTALVSRLRAAVARMRALVHATDTDTAQFGVEDADFHRDIVAAAGNPFLIGFYDSLRERQRRMTDVLLQRDSGYTQRIVEQHEYLVGRIEAGDVEGFTTELAVHLSAAHGPWKVPLR